jgi:hypothetical protein
MKQQNGKIYSCPEFCSIPRHVYLLSFLRFLRTGLYTVIKTMRFIPVIRGSAQGRVNFANDFATNRTFMGFLQARITCAGQSFS